MSNSKSREEILSHVDSILNEMKWKGPPSDLSHLNSPTHLTLFKKLGNQEKVTSQRIIAKTLHRAIELGGTIRVCSIGCEDGTLDRIVLEGLREVKVQYVGFENDEQVCEAAMDKLSRISPDIEVSTVMVDYEEWNQEDLEQEEKLEPFDVIWMVNCTYYAVSLAPLIEGASKLLKPSGEMLVISSNMQSFEKLIMQFWSHQRSHRLHTTDSVIQVLTQLNLPHVMSSEPITFDLTTEMLDDFQSPASSLVLDHLVFCRLSDYPPEVASLVVEYLKTIAHATKTTTDHDTTDHDTSSKMIISSMSDLIINCV